MADDRTMIEQAYSAFNKRYIERALALMTEDVSWPKASEGGRVVGKEEIRAYWTRQCEVRVHVNAKGCDNISEVPYEEVEN